MSTPAAEAIKRRSQNHYKQIVPLIQQYILEDLSYTQIANKLTTLGLKNTKGKQLDRATVFYIAKIYGLQRVA